VDLNTDVKVLSSEEILLVRRSHTSQSWASPYIRVRTRKNWSELDGAIP
jgi:hypothetical protein